MKRKINWLKLISAIISVMIITYISICTISYTIKTTKQVKQYEPKETIIVK